MRVVRRFIGEHDLLFTKIRGRIHDDRLLKYASALNGRSKDMCSSKQLIDFREVSCIRRVTLEGTASYAEKEPARPGNLLALLIPDDPKSREFASAYKDKALGKRRGVEVFTNLDQALRWLDDGNNYTYEDAGMMVAED